MPLSAGDRLGPYHIVATIGKGGMGEVYKGRDTRLGRDVAIKISNGKFSERFEREARSIAALNHPNICHLYDVGPDYLVMELVEGAFPKSHLPLATALDYARQLADALEAAHDRGIIHRDLKPANLLITPAGVVKVLDFGLATTQDTPVADPENSPTLTFSPTQAGMIIGTAAYMSPEQATGKPLDKRTDIWSFGVVFYEMLTGQRLFEGSAVTEILAAVLRGPIDFDGLPRETPPSVRQLLRRCLDRDPKTRLRDIGEARIAIDNASRAPEAAATVSKSYTWSGWLAAALALCVATAAGVGWWKATRTVPRPMVRLELDPGPYDNFALSPDGTRVVFVEAGHLVTRLLSQSDDVELHGTEGAENPFFSPDGKWLGFANGGKLQKIGVDGGPVVTLCNAPGLRGASWGEDHTIVAALSVAEGLFRVADAGGEPKPLTTLAQGEYTHRLPQILPGGKAVLFTTSPAAGKFELASIEAVSLHDHQRKTLLRGGTCGRYFQVAGGTGYLLYYSKGSLFAVDFDPDNLQLRGTPRAVLQNVLYNSPTGWAAFEFSRDGTLVYMDRPGNATVSLQWLVSGVNPEPLPARPGSYSDVQLSPDGKLVALAISQGDGSDIWTYDWRRDTMSRLTHGDRVFSHPVWSPDGRYLVFSADSEMFSARADGSGNPQSLTVSKGVQYPGSFSPDGKRLAFADFSSGPGVIYTVPIEEKVDGLQAGKPEVLVTDPGDQRNPSFSPDGQWIAYESTEGGASQIYVRPYPAKGVKWQVSNSGGTSAVWSPKGRELFYRANGQIMVAGYTTKGPSFAPEKPRQWAPVRPGGYGVGNLGITPDGNHLLALLPNVEGGQKAADHRMTFLMNFGDELQRRMN